MKTGYKRTYRQRKFIKAYIENGGNATKAYMEMNPKYKGKWARKLGSRMWTNLDISFGELIELTGITDLSLNKKLNEGLDANKVISVVPIPPKKNQENSIDLPDADSKNIEFVEVPDYGIRFRYLDMAYKIKDKYPSENHTINVKGELKLIDAKRKLISKIDNLASKKGKGQTS